MLGRILQEDIERNTPLSVLIRSCKNVVTTASITAAGFWERFPFVLGASCAALERRIPRQAGQKTSDEAKLLLTAHVSSSFIFEYVKSFEYAGIHGVGCKPQKFLTSREGFARFACAILFSLSG